MHTQHVSNMNVTIHRAVVCLVRRSSSSSCMYAVNVQFMYAFTTFTVIGVVMGKCTVVYSLCTPARGHNFNEWEWE